MAGVCSAKGAAQLVCIANFSALFLRTEKFTRVFTEMQSCVRTLRAKMPRRSASEHQTRSVSVATARPLPGFSAHTVRMLCSRSASLITIASGSSTIVRIRLRSSSSSRRPAGTPAFPSAAGAGWMTCMFRFIMKGARMKPHTLPQTALPCAY